jgi:hypothetical protein
LPFEGLQFVVTAARTSKATVYLFEEEEEESK